MKKKTMFFVAAIAMLFTAINANAQQLRVYAGYAPQNYKTEFKSGSSTINDTLKMNGFFLGGSYNVNVKGDLNVSIGLQARFNYFSDSVTSSFGYVFSGKIKRTDKQFVIDVPILFNYGFDLSKDVKASFFAGPTLSYAVSGKTVNEGKASVFGIGGTSKKEINWYDEDEGNMKPFDVSVTLGVNLQWQQYNFFGGYNMGLMNLSNADNTTRKGSNFFMGIGYKL